MPISRKPTIQKIVIAAFEKNLDIDTDVLVKRVLKAFPGSAINPKHIDWYASQFKMHLLPGQKDYVGSKVRAEYLRPKNKHKAKKLNKKAAKKATKKTIKKKAPKKKTVKKSKIKKAA